MKEQKRLFGLLPLIVAVGCASQEVKPTTVTLLTQPAKQDTPTLPAPSFFEPLPPRPSDILETPAPVRTISPYSSPYSTSDFDEKPSERRPAVVVTPSPEVIPATAPGDIVIVTEEGTFLVHPDQSKEKIKPGLFSAPDQSVFPNWPYRLVLSDVINKDNCRAVMTLPLDGHGSTQTIATTPNKWECVYQRPVIGPRGYGAVFVQSGSQVQIMLVEPFQTNHRAIIFKGPPWIKRGKDLYWLAGPHFGKLLMVAQTTIGTEAFILPGTPRSYPNESFISGNRGVAESGNQLSEKMMRINVSLPRPLTSLGHVIDAFPVPHPISPVYPHFPD
jgi:hypothetical protein